MIVAAIVPCRDGAESVGETVAALLADRAIDEVVVVDDGSVDDTGLVARSGGARVVRLDKNRGKAAAVQAGVEATASDVYLLVDADTGSSARGALPLLAPLVAGEVDMAIGVLPDAGTKGGFGSVKRFASWGIRRACGFEAASPLSGQRAVRAEILKQGAPSFRFGLEVAMTIDAVRQGHALWSYRSKWTISIVAERFAVSCTVEVKGWMLQGRFGLD